MDAQFTATEPSVASTEVFQKLVITKIAGIVMRILLRNGSPWFSLVDIARLLGYTGNSPWNSLGSVLLTHGFKIEDYVVLFSTDNRPRYYINTEGLDLIRSYAKEERTAGLRKWIDDGGYSNTLNQFGLAGMSEHAAFAAPSSPLPPTGKPVTENHLADDPADYPAVYILLPGDYNGWPISLVRHEGKIWLIAHEVAAILSRDGEAMAKIQAMLADEHANGHPALIKIRLGGTPTPILVVDPSAVATAAGIDSPESAAFAAWCAGLNNAPALAEVKALHEEPDGETPAKRMARIYAWQQRVDRQLMDVVSQIRGIHELAELSAGGESKFSVGDLGGMLKVARRLVEETEELFTGGELDMLHLRNDLAKQEEVLH